MPTECSTRAFDFQPLGSRQVTAGFDGGTITSDAGGLLLREVEAQTGLLADLACCFEDFRDPELIEQVMIEWAEQGWWTASDGLSKEVFDATLAFYEDFSDYDNELTYETVVLLPPEG